MLPYDYFIGLRYLKAKRKQTFISIISVISVGGVALGVMALIVVLALMNGFTGDLREKILGTNAHVVVLSHNKGGIANYPAVIAEIEKVPGVVGAAPFVYSQVMFTSSRNVSGVVLRGIDVKSEALVTNIARNIKEGQLSALDSSEAATDGVVIGEELAKNLGVVCGDTLMMVSPMGTLTPLGMTPKMKKFQVVALFNSGMYEYDATLAYVSLKSTQQFFNMGDHITGIEVKVSDIYQAAPLAQQIQQKLGFPFWGRNWIEMNRNLFSALKLEKIAMFIILVLIVLVAAFNIISTLIMMVMEKSRDIAILMSMGAKTKSIMRIFMIEGLVIGIMGTLIGAVAGGLTCWIADHYKLIKLAGDVYYMSHLPFKINPWDFGLVCLLSIVISFLATLYPSWQAARLDPAVALRYE